MPVDVVMPRLSDTMEEGKVLKWLKAVGDEIKKGEPIAEIETDKAAMELEAFDAGTLSKIIVSEGETVPVGEPIATIAEPTAKPTAPSPARGEAAPPIPSPAKEAAAAPIPSPAPGEAKPTIPSPFQSLPPTRSGGEVEGQGRPSAERVKASPLARRIAEEQGIDLSAVSGTGPDGRITKEDVLAFVKQAEETKQAPPVRPSPAARGEAAMPTPVQGEDEGEGRIPASDTRPRLVDMTRMQATIAERMTKARQTIPQFYVTSRIEMSEAARMVAALAAAGQEDARISYNELIIKASALALRKIPIVNAFFADGKLQYNDRISIGIAVALPQGLIVPVLHDADKKSLRDIAAEARRLIVGVREGHMVPDDFEGATFTVSNLGMFDVEEFTAIIDPPESAILAVGSVHQAPVVRDGQLAVSESMKVTLSVDHRVFYGATGAQFLQEFKRLLQNPILLAV